MINFNLYIPKNLNGSQMLTEKEIIVSIEEVIEDRNNLSLFTESAYYLCQQIESISKASFEIRAYNLEWNYYVYFLNDVLVDIIDSLELIKSTKPFKISFYEQGSGRELIFTKKSASVYDTHCADIMSKVKIGFFETIDNLHLYNMFINIVIEFIDFVKTNYPNVFVDYIKPYLDEKRIGWVDEKNPTIHII